MLVTRKHLLYFGPLTVIIEWLGILAGFHYAKDFNLDSALSTLASAPNPLPIIFSLTLLLAGMSYFIFSFSLRFYSKRIPVLAFASGLLLALTGLITYTGQGGLQDILHNLCIYLSISGYAAIIWAMKKHPMQAVKRVSAFAFWVMLLSVVLAFICLFIINRYAALAELLILVIIQAWTIVIVWHDKTN